MLTLNRPEKRNALSDDLVQALLDRIDEARSHEVPALVFRGEGRNFSAGFDFGDFADVSRADLLWRFVRVQQLLTAVQSYPGLTLAMAHGRNFGAGCDLFAACDVRLATQDARFRMPGVLFGLVLGTRRLGRLVGESAASRIQLSATEFDCQEALDLNFVTGTVADTLAPDLGLLRECMRVPLATRRAICDALAQDSRHEDMGRLVESVMTGDIRERLAAYLGQH